METVKVVNIKCGGCEKGIIDALSKNGAQNITVDIDNQEISFEGDRAMVCRQLNAMGYPEKSSKEARSVLKKAKSYLSCMLGKTKK